MTPGFQASFIEISNTLGGTDMGEAKREIMYHFRLNADFDRCNKIWKVKNKMFDFEVLELVKC